MKTYHILLIGAGQIGSRHLQALGLSDLPINISVVDTTQTSLLLAKKDMSKSAKKIMFNIIVNLRSLKMK